MTDFDVITIGRVGVDLYPLQVGVGLEDVTTFGKFLGGSATNVAVAAARHGRRSAVITRTGDDPFGRFVHRALRELGMDDRYVTAIDGLPTPVTFCEIFPPDDFPLYFYRLPKAPDLVISDDELDLPAIVGAGAFWATVTGLSQEPSRHAHDVAWQARERRPLTVLDLDYRPMFWESREAARAEVQHALGKVTVTVGNLDECETAVGERDPLGASDAGDRGERAGRGRRLRGRPVPRAARRLATRTNGPVRQCGRRDRRVPAGVLDGHADHRRGRGAAGGAPCLISSGCASCGRITRPRWPRQRLRGGGARCWVPMAG